MDYSERVKHTPGLASVNLDIPSDFWPDPPTMAARDATAPHRGDGETHPFPELAKRMGEDDYGPVFIGPPGSRTYLFAKAPKRRKVIKESALKAELIPLTLLS